MATIDRGGKRVRWIDPATGQRTARTFTSARAAQRFAEEIQEQRQLIKDGYIDVRTLERAEEIRRPIDELLTEYRAYLSGKGDTVRHVQQVIRAAERVFKDAGIVEAGDLEAQRLARFFEGKRQEHTKDEADQIRRVWGNRTMTYHVGAVRAFCQWLERSGRLEKDPTVALPRPNAALDRRCVARALTVAEVEALIRAGRGRLSTRCVCGRAFAAGKPNGCDGPTSTWRSAQFGFGRRAPRTARPTCCRSPILP